MNLVKAKTVEERFFNVMWNKERRELNFSFLDVTVRSVQVDLLLMANA